MYAQRDNAGPARPRATRFGEAGLRYLLTSELTSCGLLAVLYSLLAAIHTYPLLADLHSSLPGLGLGDNVTFAWNIWWMREALASPELEFFRSPAVLVPFGASLALHTHTALAAFVGATLLFPLDVISAQNVVLIASLALNGLTTYLLAFEVSGSRRSSVAAGALFVVAPAITTRLMGHFNLVMAWPLVLACVALVRWMRVRTWRAGLLLAVSAALLPYTDYYFTVYFVLFAAASVASDVWTVSLRVRQTDRVAVSTTLIVLGVLMFLIAATIGVLKPSALALGSLTISLRTPTNALTASWLLLIVGALVRWRPRMSVRRRPDAMTAATIVRLAPFVLFAIVLMAPLLVAVFRIWQAGEYVTQTSSLRSSPRGVDLATLVLGPPVGGVLGETVRSAYDRFGLDPMESSAWIGAALLVLLAISMRVLKSDSDARRWLRLGAVFFVWALGPYLQIFGANTGLVLPLALARLIPVVNNARIPGRAIVPATICAVVLVALALTRAKPRLQTTMWALVAIGIVESIAAPLPVVRMPSLAVYEKLGGSLADRRVLVVPFGVRDGFKQRGALQHTDLFAQFHFPHRLVGGFLARIPRSTWTWYETTEPYRTLLDLSDGQPLSGLPTCADIAAGLRTAGVSHVIVERQSASPALTEFVERFPLRLVADEGQRSLFAVAADGCR